MISEGSCEDWSNGCSVLQKKKLHCKFKKNNNNNSNIFYVIIFHSIAVFLAIIKYIKNKNKTFRVSKILVFEKSLLSPKLHIFDQNYIKNCDTVKHYCNLKCLKMSFYLIFLNIYFSTSAACSCSPYGTVDRKTSCSQVTGQCQCLPHVSNRDCSACEPGFYNLQSGKGCERYLSYFSLSFFHWSRQTCKFRTDP